MSDVDASAADPLAPASPPGSVEIGVPQRLHPSARTVRWITDLMVCAVLAAGACLTEVLWLLPKQVLPFDAPVLSPVIAALLLVLAVVYPPFWYRSWTYTLREHDVLLRYGVLWRTRRAVPRHRIQHADIRSGPIDRAFGLCSLTLYTAGSADEDAVVPGITEAAAESLRDQLLHPRDHGA